MANGVPKKYLVDGIEAVGYNKLNSTTEAVGFKTPNGTKFSLARDMMGIQFCAGGRLWPRQMGFASMNEAIMYIKEHTAEAIAFFDSTEEGAPFAVLNTLFAVASAVARDKHDALS